MGLWRAQTATQFESLALCTEMPDIRATQTAHHTMATIMQFDQLNPSTPYSTSIPTSPLRLMRSSCVSASVGVPHLSPPRIVDSSEFAASGTVDPQRLRLKIITTDSNETMAASHLRTSALGTTSPSLLGSQSMPASETDKIMPDGPGSVSLVPAQDGCTFVGIYEDPTTSSVNFHYNFQTQPPYTEHTNVEGISQPIGPTFTTLLLKTVGSRCVAAMKTLMAAEAVSVCLIAVAQYLHAGNPSCHCTADDYLDSEGFQLGIRQMLAGTAFASTMTLTPPQSIQHQRTRAVLECLRQWLAGWPCSETDWKPVAACDSRFLRARACIASSIRATGHSRGDVVGKWASETLLAPEAVPDPDRWARNNIMHGKLRSKSDSPTRTTLEAGPTTPDHKFATSLSQHGQTRGSVESEPTRRSSRSSTSRSVDYNQNRHPQDEHIIGYGKRRRLDACERSTKKAKLENCNPI